ncbi:regulator of G-protein signaling 22-like isoform X1 [Scyliorhinus torazame]|uniref:regulator of G-protein signaling 22-like isoform X1 n=1 Tax=Scyliorhinus torazame TaxID=75743 RepID=UPI003B595C8F
MEQRNKPPEKFTTAPPHVTADDFEDYLVTDDLLVDYFNIFLSLFSFPKPICFNKETETFEVVDNAKTNLIKHLKSLEYAHTPMDPIYDVTIKSERKYPQFEQNISAIGLKFGSSFTVQCLDREQGVAWVKNERLPAFLQSDCYFEYRLSKLLSQLECNTGPGTPEIDCTYHPWILESEEQPMPKVADKVEVAMKELYICLGEASITQTEALFTEAKGSIPLIVIQSDRRPTFNINAPTEPSMISMQSSESVTSGISLLNDIMMRVEAGKLPVRLKTTRGQSSRQYFDNNELCTIGHSKPKVVDNELFEFVPEYPLQAPGTIFLEIKSEIETEQGKDREQVETDDGTTTSEEKVSTVDKRKQNTDTNLPSAPDESKPHLDINSKIDTPIVPRSTTSKTAQLDRHRSFKVSDNIRTLSENVGEEGLESDSSNEEDDTREFCYSTPRHKYDFKNSKGIEKFKKFLKGTAGEKYWWLWMDIERLKVIEDDKKKQSHLNYIRNRYLLSGGEYYMNIETRAKLGLLFMSKWTLEDLCQIQSNMVKPLLLYWGPRYCTNQGFPIRQAGIALKDWEDRQLRPKTNVGLFAKSISVPIHAKIDCTPREPKNVPQIPREEKHKPKTASHFAKRADLPNRQLLNVNRNMLNSLIIKEETKDQLLMSVGSIWSQASTSMQVFEEQELREVKEVQNLEKLMRITNYHYALCDYKTDNMLHALHHESRTGYIFTQFCKETGNLAHLANQVLDSSHESCPEAEFTDPYIEDPSQRSSARSIRDHNLLWNNGVNLWCDLKEYQRLFYAEAFQPFRLRRQAQFIFATYISEGAPADVELDTENRKMLYRKLEPPFEELFDHVEEYVLVLLLVPWIHMIEMDMSRFRKVQSMYLNIFLNVSRK